MTNSSLIVIGKLLSGTAKTLNLGNGSTWPGHIALRLNKHFIRQTLHKSGIKTIIVAGTNGKTTTSKLIATLLEADNQKVLQNISGANLLNGIASSLILNSNSQGKLEKDFAIFEVDENALPLVLKEIHPDYLVLLNLFRDQLDRYGEVNSIAENWTKALQTVPKTTTLILNADDLQVAFLAEKTQLTAKFFDISAKAEVRKKYEDVTDSTFCPKCGNELDYTYRAFSHLGDWRCPHCKLKKPKTEVISSPVYPLSGVYNMYNTHAAFLTAKMAGISKIALQDGLNKFTPAFGRQEHIVLNGRDIQIFLSKNPIGFNESLRTIKQQGGKHMLLVLNDGIADGKDVSWIWDTDMENIFHGDEHLYISGTRAYDMATRIKYSQKEFPISNFQFPINQDLKVVVNQALNDLPASETLYIIPTYTAMLQVRKVLTGKEIL